MHFSSFANVNETDLRTAQQQVLQGDNTPDMLRELALRPYWQAYVRQRYPERFEALVAPLHERLAELELQARGGQEQVYVDKSEAMMKQLASAERQLYQVLAEEAWARVNP
ncbi:hypothetical protein D3C79_936240 [compost metagenome]